MDTELAALQRRLSYVLALNRPGVTGAPHVWVVLPSYSVAEPLLIHYGDRIPALEHRYLIALLALANIRSAEMVFVTCRAPEPEVLDHYFGLMPSDVREDARRRFRVFVVDDARPMAVAAKLLDREDLVAALRESFQGKPAFIDPWNVAAAEVAVAKALDAPLNGTDPSLWPVGFKSAGRRVFAAAGVLHPFGVEDVCSAGEAAAAAEMVRGARPSAVGVVVKHDDSGSGDGNVVVDFAGLPADPRAARLLSKRRWKPFRRPTSRSWPGARWSRS